MCTRTWNLALVAIALFLPQLAGHGQDRKPAAPRKPVAARADEPKPDKDKVKALMRRKLEYAQKVLEALTLNDLNVAGKNASELLKLRKDPIFQVIKTPEYELWSNEFTRSAEGMVQAAKDKNLEAGKLAYLGMTMSCFNCHTYVRDLRRTKLD